MKKSAPAEVVQPSSQCSICHCDLGLKASVLAHDCDGELFCPRCFVYQRAPKEPERFAPEYFSPIYCARCGMQSVSFQGTRCGQCGNRAARALPPVGSRQPS